MLIFLRYRFWILNVSFWILYYVTQTTTSPVFLGFPPFFRFILCLSFIVFIVLITSSYRFVYKKYGFDKKSFRFTIFQCFISLVAMLMIDVILRFFVNPFFLKNFETPTSSFNYASKLSIIASQNPNSEEAIFLNQLLANGQVIKLYAIAIWLILYNFYNYYKQLKATEIEKLKAQNKLKDAELINLRQQLNPHFLFNALNSIHALVSLKKENAAQSVMNLSDLMRYSLNYSKREFITVEEEINSVRQYLELEKLRFGERLNFTIEAEQSVNQKDILFAIVQTLVENAVKHSVQKNLDAGYVEVSVSKKNRFLEITVENTGQITSAEFKTANSGIGLENLRQRLQLCYDGIAQFSLENKGTTRVIARLRVPI